MQEKVSKFETEAAAPQDSAVSAEEACATATSEPAVQIAQLQAALAQSELASGAARDAQLRALAELDNVRKRAQRDIDNAQRYALERFAAELLPARDSLELAAQSAASADSASLIAGQQATLQLLSAAFEKFSIQRVDPHGASFDPAVHEAVGTVLQVLQSGYQLNGRLLRPARVIVSRAPGA
jgi:molecular chaperone GrpE